MDTTTDLPRVLEQLWGIEGRQRPGPKPAFHISDIARAAITLADSGGLAAVSMSKVAAALGFTTMSLYRYVDAKDDLYVVMLDHAFGEPPVLEQATWRERITAWAEAFRDAMVRHPWILQVPVFEPPLSPNQLAWMEQGLRAFEDTALAPGERVSSMLLVNIYVRGAVQITADMQSRSAEEAREADRLYNARLRLLADPERFPAIVAGLVDPGGHDDEGDPSEFIFGLDSVLDGIQARIDRKAEKP
ncbi:TetR/AcrR family transcriptional regulator [Kribbella sp. NPDC050820]|uniref:TetR/AcrR family transcriptional regulator n=1 Tax=Kribbella sp. NPDC050820 TaxID=3155408 RepID=UPI0033C0AC7B